MKKYTTIAKKNTKKDPLLLLLLLLLLLISVGSRFPGVEPRADDKNGRRKAYFIRAYHDDR